MRNLYKSALIGSTLALAPIACFTVAHAATEASFAPITGPRIWKIQGEAHHSAMAGRVVRRVPGIVTARTADGVFIQDPDGDENPNTSDAIFVSTGSAPPAFAVAGAQLLVTGEVQEATDDPHHSGLSKTIIASTSIDHHMGERIFTREQVRPVVLGVGGRIPPGQIIDNDTNGDVGTSASHQFDPAQDGLDFYESLEGMLVQVNAARAVSPQRHSNEVWVVADGGSAASGNNSRGGLSVTKIDSAVDFNPEKLLLEGGLNGSSAPIVKVGDDLGDLQAVLDYRSGKFRLRLLQSPSVTARPLPPTTRNLPTGGDHLSVATYHFSSADPSNDFIAAAGAQIVNALGSPDLLSISGVPDDSGSADDGVVSSTATVTKLRTAIKAAGGPHYEAAFIDPIDGQDGDSANRRIVQLFVPNRIGLFSGNLGNGGNAAITATTPVASEYGGIFLTRSPGRIEPTESAWNGASKPMAAQYSFNGRRLVMISVDLKSGISDQPLFGSLQPPTRNSENQRLEQAAAVRRFVSKLQGLQPSVRVVLLGNFEDTDFSPTLSAISNGIRGTSDALTNLVSGAITNPVERYSANIDGNSISLDHILMSPALVSADPRLQILHINSEYPALASSRDTVVATVLLPENDAPYCDMTTDNINPKPGEIVTLYLGWTDDPASADHRFIWNAPVNAPPFFLIDGPTAKFVAPRFPYETRGDQRQMYFTASVNDADGAGGGCGMTITGARPDEDNTPDPFEFTHVLGAPTSTYVVSNEIVISGVEPYGQPSIINGGFSINEGCYTDEPDFHCYYDDIDYGGALVRNGDRVRVRLRTSSQPGTTTSAQLTIGGITTTFSVTTAGGDSTPLPFSFEARDNAPLTSSIESNSAMVLGINAPAAITVSGGEFSINGGAYTAMVGAVVNDGDLVRVRLTAAPTFSTARTATLTIGGVSADFTVTTLAADSTPDAFSFGAVSGVARNSEQVSAAVTVAGINTGAPIAVSGGSYSINGGPFVTGGGTVRAGDSVRLRGTASARFNASTTVTATIGGVSGDFTITTRRLLQGRNGG